MVVEEQVRKTYHQLRLLAGTTLIVLPVAIVLTAWFLHEIILPTLSHYYFGEKTPFFIRTMFTGFLILVGGIMLSYRGFDSKDNWIHTGAGLAAICVAIFPKQCDKQDVACVVFKLSVLHFPSAFILFVLAAYAVWYGGGKNLKKNLNDSEIKKLTIAKSVSLATMALGIVFYGFIFLIGGVSSLPTTAVLVIEMLGFFGFALHWLMTSFVINKANNRRLKDALTQPTSPAAAPAAPGTAPRDDAAVKAPELIP